MARADLLIRLVQSGIRGDKASFRKVVEAIIAEERTKQYKVLAEKLERWKMNMTIVGPPECCICHDRAEEITASGAAYCGKCYSEIRAKRAAEARPIGLDAALAMVREFHRSFECPVGDEPTQLSRARIIKRVAWMHEEITEFVMADRLEEQADAMIDLIYFALGTLVEMGVHNPQELLEVVHAANMAKLGADGKPIYVDGKVSKPVGWRAPRLGGIIR